MKKAVCILIALICSMTILPSCRRDQSDKGEKADPSSLSTPSIVSEISSVVHPPVVGDDPSGSSEKEEESSSESNQSSSSPLLK